MRGTQKYVSVRRPVPATGNGSQNEGEIAHSTGVFRDTLYVGLGHSPVGLGSYKEKSVYVIRLTRGRYPEVHQRISPYAKNGKQ